MTFCHHLRNMIIYTNLSISQFFPDSNSGAATAVMSVQSATGSVHANILMSGIAGASDGEKNVPIQVTFVTTAQGETRTISEDLLIPKLDQVIQNTVLGRQYHTTDFTSGFFSTLDPKPIGTKVSEKLSYGKISLS